MNFTEAWFELGRKIIVTCRAQIAPKRYSHFRILKTGSLPGLFGSNLTKLEFVIVFLSTYILFLVQRILGISHKY